ncbi:uncharacterized protein LOC109852890 [Pseudomyrmex gracilis]|uniref:uncharacterized protein LOC109852890 n=1 Tax=Pseudomyrmex gracilis TaxID=219809 RepID=UPI00099564B0|nr:uncharacterized protein LOC109852890 [Pseudomyrmex gracilis]
MRLSLLGVTIATIFVLAIVHAPVEANAVADPEAWWIFDNWGIERLYNQLKHKISDIETIGLEVLCTDVHLEMFCALVSLFENL